MTQKRNWIANIILVVLIVSLALLLVAKPAEAANNYSDIGGHWARDAIVRWGTLGALDDFPAGAFRPDTPITRAEFFSILVRALGATETADISRFSDVAEDAWYYDTVAIANRIRLAEGNSETTMGPEANIIRQDAATLVARAMGLANDNANYLYRYSDGGNISDYARNYVSVVTEHGYMTGSYGSFNPRSFLSRAEAVKIVDNLFAHYYMPEVGFDSFTLNGNVMSNRSESVFNNLTINGDLIIADGAGAGNATLNNCTINGRLLLRGGGPNSVVLNDTYVGKGITVISPTTTPRIVTTGSTYAPTLTAFSSFILDGIGVHEAVIADNAFFGSEAVLDGVVLDYLYVGGVGASVNLSEGKISNFYIGGAADGATVNLAAGTIVDYLSTVSPNTTINGAGKLGDVFINAPGAIIGLSPETYTLGANLSATIAGKSESGLVLDTPHTVVRNNKHLAISQDSGETGGNSIFINTAEGRSSNSALVTQLINTEIPLDNNGDRWGYYIGFFIPSPTGSDNDIEQLTYRNSDGALTIMENVSLSRKGGVYGLEFLIPVRRENAVLRGRLDEMLYIQWNSQLSENLQFHSGWLALEPLSDTQVVRLVDEYEQARFYGLDGTRYDGNEALRRLLSSDNALGLDIQGFDGFSAEDQQDLSARLIELSDVFNSTEEIQDALNKVLTGKAALYAVNNALTVAQMRWAFENMAYAKELAIESGATSMYGGLSEVGKERVSRTILTGRSKDFVNAAAVKTAFDKAVSDTRLSENNLLVSLNGAKNAGSVQKIIETKANADVLDFLPGEAPYSICPASLRLELGQRILDAAPFYTVDEAARIITDFLVTVDEVGITPEATITGISISITSMSLLAGQEDNFTIAVTYSDGVVKNGLDKVNVTNSAPNVVDVDMTNSKVLAKSVGSAKITFALKDDAKKTVTLSVTVKAPVASTGVTLDKTYVEIGEGSNNMWLVAKMTPTNTTDTLIWRSLDESIATVDSNGRLTGIAPGFTTITVLTSSNQVASCEVVVISKNPGVMVMPKTATVGIGQNTQLKYVVSPVDLPNRTVKWTSSNASVAIVDAFGKVTGIDGGTAIITAISNYDNTLTDTATVTVDPDIKMITLNKQSVVMFPRGIEQLKATVTPASPGGDVVKWGVRDISGGTTVVNIDPDTGIITGVAPGTASVFAYLQSDSSVVAECSVQVMTGSLSITPNPLNISVNVESSTVTSVFTYKPDTVTNKNIKWTISPNDGTDNDGPIASFEVNGNGSLTITGKVAGAATITGIPEADNTQSMRINVTVTNVAVSSFSLSTDHIYLDEGDTRVLTDWTDPNMINVSIIPANATDKTISWSSNSVGQVSITNVSATTQNPYGASTIYAASSTFTKEVTVQNPDGTTSIQMVDEPVQMTATASNGSRRQVLVTVRPKSSESINNIKIDVDRWVYAVGDKQYLSVYFNVTKREDGRWLTGTQPANKEITWSSGDDTVATVLPTGELVAHKPGIVNITATAKVGSAYDVVTLVITEYGINSLAFSNLSQEAGYGRFIEMFVGEEMDVTANISPTQALNSRVVWQPWLWQYDNDDVNDTSGSETAIGSEVLGITSSTNPWNVGHLTARKPGLVRVSVIPIDVEGKQNPDKIGSMSLNSLEALCSKLGLSFETFLAKNAIVRVGSDYFTENEASLSVPNTPTPILPVPLDPTRIMNLVVPGQVENNNFFVWVKSRTPQSFSITTAAGLSLINGQQEQVRAKLDPALTSGEITINWAVSPSDATKLELVAGSDGYNSTSGESYASFKAIVDGPNSATVNVTASRPAEQGLKSPTTGMPRKVNPAVNLSASYLISIVQQAMALGMPLSSGFSLPADSPLATPVTPNTIAQPSGPVILRNINISLNSGVSSALLAIAARSEAMTPDITSYTSANTAVAVVSGSGIITAVSPGSTTISATCGNRVITATVNVSAGGVAAATSNTLSLRKTASLPVGTSLTLVPVMAAANYDLSAISWVSSNPAIATVDGNGIVRAIKAGRANITATVPGTKLKAICAVTVAAEAKIPLTGITLNNSILTLEAGKSATLKAICQPGNASLKGISWFSSDRDIAYVDQAGIVSGVAAGSATITVVSDQGGHLASCTVTVSAAPIKVTGVTLNYSSLGLKVGEQFTFSHSIMPTNAANQEVIWTTSNKSVLSVENGKITALKKGTAVVQVTTVDGRYKASCRVTIK